MTLATRYLGLDLCTPFIVGASPLCDDVSVARKLVTAGAGALVLRSLFEEQLDPSPPAPRWAGMAEYQLSPDRYVRHLARLKKAVAVPVIASLNGTRPGPWARFASRLEDAGADAIELNFYRLVTDIGVPADRIESEMLETVGLVSDIVRVPVAVKLSPFHTALAQLAVALELAGASGLVVFNRFYQPDVDTAKVEVRPQLRLSAAGETPLRLRWLAILSPHVRGSLAATGGFHTADAAVKAFLTGAHAVQVVSILLSRGPGALRTMTAGVRRWMKAHRCDTLADFRGRLNLRAVADPAAFERAGYRRTLQSWEV